MPAPRAAAVFEPIPPDLDLAALVESTENFEYANRISCDVIDIHGSEEFEKLVLLHVILGGKPLVIEGFQNRLDRWAFSTQWLRDNIGKKIEYARDLSKGEHLPLSINHYLDNMTMLTNQCTTNNYKTAKQRLYLKDIDCPETWHDKLKEHIPPGLFYLNECTGEARGEEAVEEQQGNNAAFQKMREFARAGDLMSSLPPLMRAQNMMCYIGHEGTYTPAHREMCASLGQNIMVEASGSVGEDGKPTKPGSSIWFMTESKDRHLVSEYWLSTLGHDIEVESHFAQINAWTRAPFKVYIVEQKVGDFILVPPLAPHQVWNRGTRTMKAAWNRTTVETLVLALEEALPRARMVCRDEQYKNKAIVLFSLNRYSGLIKKLEHLKNATRSKEILEHLTTDTKIKQLQKDFKRLFRLFNGILLSETFSPKLPEKKPDLIEFDSNITCSYCRCNIFNRFLTCKACVIQLEDEGEDTYDICMECYAMGRSCSCISKLSWAEQFPWKDLVKKHETWRKQLIEIEKGTKPKIKTPECLEEERNIMEKKSLAEVCQEQLRIRPFKDPKKISKSNPKLPSSDEEEEEEEEGDSSRKRTPKKRSDKWLKDNLPCHICSWRHERWKMAVCECGAAFCYGSLWRGFDTLPQTIMEDPYWRCPKCRETCNCSPCRKKEFNRPYQPNGTILGHDTRKFADPRSVEALVDFSSSNTHWLRKAGDDQDPTETWRMQKRKFEAEHAKSKNPTEDEDDEAPESADEADTGIPTHFEEDSITNTSVPIDPLLVDEATRSSLDPGDTRRVARDALSALNDLSRLEQDPAAFIAQAGLRASYDGTSDNMVMHKASNGITYWIQNPGGGTGGDQQKTMAEATGKKAKRARRRAAYKQKVDDEAAQFVNDANRRFYQSQAEKSMSEAKKKGRLISARAALTGEKLVIRLKLPPPQLAQFTRESDIEPMVEPMGQEEVLDTHVQSDLPKENLAGNGAAKGSYLSKKRRREEEDGEFAVSQDRRKRPTVDRSSSPEKTDDVSDSGPEFEELAGAGKRNGIAETGTKGRQLPAYLARRSPVNDSDLPKELASMERARSVQKRKPVSNSVFDATSFPSNETESLPPLLSTQIESYPNEVELNRRAKLKAINGEISSTNSDSDDSLVAKQPRPLPRQPRVPDIRPTMTSKHGSKGTQKSDAPKNVQPASRGSILSKIRGGKVKIVSSRSMGSSA